MSYSRTGGKKIEIIVRDEDFAVIGRFKCHQNDFPKVVKILRSKFGINYKIVISHEQSINNLNKIKEKKEKQEEENSKESKEKDSDKKKVDWMGKVKW